MAESSGPAFAKPIFLAIVLFALIGGTLAVYGAMRMIAQATAPYPHKDEAKKEAGK